MPVSLNCAPQEAVLRAFLLAAAAAWQSGSLRRQSALGEGFTDRDKLLMRLALGEARRGIGLTSPNPAVGAVVARNGEVLSTAHHRRPGGAHAERRVLERLSGVDLRGATLYVNLEPCCHYGATPPCTELIIERGLERVVAAMADPNPLVNGKGFAALREAGVRVDVGVLAGHAARLNEAYVTRMSLGRPFVAVKAAATLDGRIADARGRSRWITSDKARRFAHYLRATYDAVLVGARTVLSDDPRLDVRLVRGRSPLKIVLDPDLCSLSPQARLMDSGSAPTVFACAVGSAGERASLASSLGVRLWEVPQGSGGLDLEALLRRSAEEGISSLLVEGGARTVTSFMRAGLVDKLYLFAAPRLMGGGLHWLGDAGFRGLSGGPCIEGLEVKRVGSDVLLCGYLRWGLRETAEANSEG